MKNIAIVVDSSCGLTENQAKKLDLFYLPLMIEVDGKVYREGIDVSSENLFEVFTLKSSKQPLLLLRLVMLLNCLQNYQKNMII
ncbi:DegV family protein [Mycoplasmopsis felis]|nr:DegV family protein [Mycoplasmopsis felis]WAM01233.1 DegV family protein [Mycoplasmopsis felis]